MYELRVHNLIFLFAVLCRDRDFQTFLLKLPSFLLCATQLPFESTDLSVQIFMLMFDFLGS